VPPGYVPFLGCLVNTSVVQRDYVRGTVCKLTCAKPFASGHAAGCGKRAGWSVANSIICGFEPGIAGPGEQPRLAITGKQRGASSGSAKCDA
jgi:hypothetical protein